MPKDECAAGIYPLPTKRTPNDIETADTRMVEMFAPRGDVADVNGVLSAECHWCDQRTMVKTESPRKGFFIFHRSSIKGNVRASETTASGKPARIRGRRG